ncbi:MAG: hypothetical protein FJW90_04255 [Actinobacteria bacterium]|nr:hypothetical protein [Actinomycetota bacterium]
MDGRRHKCPDCGAGFGSASTLVDHSLSEHVQAETPAAHVRPLRRPAGLRIATAIALLFGAAFWVLAALGFAGIFEKPTVAETPGSVVHEIVVELEREGAIDSYRAVEPDAGWDTEYEVGDGDGYVRVRDEGRPGAELEYFAYPGELDRALEDAAEARGFQFGD